MDRKKEGMCKREKAGKEVEWKSKGRKHNYIKGYNDTLYPTSNADNKIKTVRGNKNRKNKVRRRIKYHVLIFSEYILRKSPRSSHLGRDPEMPSW